jgi:hypothetical protein
MANVFINDGTSQVPPEATRAMIVASDGIFQLKRIVLGGLPVIEAVTRMGEGWDGDGLLPWGGPSLRLGFAEKIPQIVLQQAVSFFRAVFDRFQTEAIVLLWYAPGAPEGQRWQIMAPEQTVDPAHCHYDDPGAAPSGWYCAGTIHSHGGMGSFHSGVDDHDEDHRDGIHITVGRVNSLVEFAVSVMVNGERFKLELADVVAGVQPTAFPAEWLERVTKPAPPPAPIMQWSGLRGEDDDDLATHRAVTAIVRPTRKGGRK